MSSQDIEVVDRAIDAVGAMEVYMLRRNHSKIKELPRFIFRDISSMYPEGYIYKDK